jgi:multiple sugar transport system substrate-binding protein
VKEAVEVEKEVTRVVEKAVKETVVIQPVTMAYYWDDAMNALLPNFHERFPHIKVEPIVVPGWSDYPVKLAAMHAAANLGDTVEYDMGWEFMEWAHKGMIRPIENLVEATGFDIDMFYPAGIEACTFKGHLVAIPQDTHPGCCAPYYNADMTLEAGLELPSNDWDYDDFLQYCQKLTVDTDGDGKTDIWAYGAHGRIKGLYPRLRANGGSMYDEECRKCLYNSEAGVQTLKDKYDVFQTHKIHPLPGGEATDALYRSGKLWMRLMTPTHIMSMTTATKDLFRTEAVVMPKSPKTGKIGTATTGIGYCMTTLTKHPEETWEFLQWIGSKWYGLAGFEGGFTTPGGRKDTWGDPIANEKWPFSKEVARILEFSEAYEIPWNYRHREIQRVFGEVEDAMYLGETLPEEAAESIVSRIDRILDKPVL